MIEQKTQHKQQPTHPQIVCEFVIVPLQRELYIKNETRVNLLYQGKENKLIKGYPIFNNDGNSTTDAFILQGENFQKETLTNCSSSFERKLQEDQSSSNILIAKPFNQKKVCSVCKQLYVDYLDHIKNRSHLQKSKSKLGTRYIEELCSQFYQDDDLFEVGKRKLKQISSEGSDSTSLKPYKKKIVQFSSSIQYPISNTNKQSLFTETGSKSIIKNQYAN